MTELLSILYKLRIFTSDELSEALKGKVKSVEALLARLTSSLKKHAFYNLLINNILYLCVT